MIPINDLSRSIADHDGVMEAISRVVRSGNWIHGPEHNAFEDELANFTGAKYAYGVGNGTDALEIALRAVGCIAGSTVITVANAGGYASIAAKSIGCKVVYCDVDPLHLVIDPESLKPLLSRAINAVVVTHLFGNVAPISRITEMCKEYGIKVIEDCAQSIGGSENGNRLGTIGDVGTFSFYPTKNLGAIGDGGALTTNSDEYSKKIQSLRQYGWDGKYRISIAGGMNSRLDEIQAAILRINLRNLLTNNQRRRDVIGLYSSGLQNSDIRLVTSGHDGSAPHLAVLLLPEESDREKFRSKLMQANISTDIHYPILDNHQDGFNDLESNSFLKVSEKLTPRILSIPLFPDLSESEISEVVSAVLSKP